MNNPVDGAFDLRNAVALLEASAAAYAPTAGGTKVASAGTDTRAVITEGEEDVVVAFRGTADLRNWITDLDCAFGAFSGSAGKIKVHAGFLAAWGSLRADLLDCLAGMAGGKPRRVWLTGHSLGGALAMLATVDLKMNMTHGANVAGCYTFGQPRVGNKAFGEWYDAWLKARTFRVVHSDDVVPRLPWLLGTYRHAGNEVFFPATREVGKPAYAVNPSLWEKLPFDLVGLGRALAYGRAALVEDHFVRSYVNILSRAPAEGWPVWKTNLHQ